MDGNATLVFNGQTIEEDTSFDWREAPSTRIPAWLNLEVQSGIHADRSFDGKMDTFPNKREPRKFDDGKREENADRADEVGRMGERTEDAGPAPLQSDPHRDAREDHAESLSIQREQKLQKLKSLAAKAQLGDEAAVTEIRAILDSDELIWQVYGDCELITEGMLIDTLASGRRDSEECIRRKVFRMKRETLSDGASVLERMAVGRVVCCWLFLQLVDRNCTWLLRNGTVTSRSGRLAECAERRYQIALKSLKLTEKLKTPG